MSQGEREAVKIDLCPVKLPADVIEAIEKEKKEREASGTPQEVGGPSDDQ